MQTSYIQLKHEQIEMGEKWLCYVLLCLWRFLEKSPSVLILGVRAKGHRSEVFLSAFPSFFPSTFVTPLCSGDMLTCGRLCVTGECTRYDFLFPTWKQDYGVRHALFFHIWGRTLLYFLLIEKIRRGQHWTGGEGGGGLGVGSASSWLKKIIVKERKKKQAQMIYEVVVQYLTETWKPQVSGRLMPGGLFIAWGQCPLESFPVYYVRTVVSCCFFPSFLFLF